MTPRAALRAFPVAALALSACALHHVPAPPPGQPADVTAMTSVVERTRARPPHRGFPLAVAPVTVSYEPDRYPLGLREEFAAAVADLRAKSGLLEPIRPPALAGVAVRRAGVYDPYDIGQYLLIRLSPVGFSADSARAALVVVYDCGPGCGSQFGVGLRRAANRGWRVTQFRRLPEPPRGDEPESPARAEALSPPPDPARLESPRAVSAHRPASPRMP